MTAVLALAVVSFRLAVATDLTTLWGAYSPYFASGTYEPPPKGCAIDQVNIVRFYPLLVSAVIILQLERHGARYPTSGATPAIVVAVQKLQNATSYADPRFDFFKDFTYTLGADSLVPFGAIQSQQAGALAYHRYSKLVTEDQLPFVRSDSKQRVVDSATNWTAGFSAASFYEYNPVLAVVLSESGNDTLDDSGCPNAGSSDLQTSAWIDASSSPITQRLNSAAPGANLNGNDTYNLMSMCAFHTVAIARGAELTLSPFCALFEDGDFVDFEYYMDLDKYYGTGYGGYLGAVQGVGYINELIARLTDSPVKDSTQTNSTLDSDPATFPLNRTIYADFSHDDELAAIYAAMGLFNQSVPLNPVELTMGRTWVASRLVPFAARMVVERMQCEGAVGTVKALRVFVNDVLQPLGGGIYYTRAVHHMNCESTEDKHVCRGWLSSHHNTRCQRLEFCRARSGERWPVEICSVNDFVQSQGYARRDGDGDWQKCSV
ncbi:Phytase [Mycena chlorophos]|uniref:Phytase A n=1 Tax=Mycena chlorophos TaxID=658473 RepID=A0A8H6WL34_MYCCL|nr:Phytase [Mycena chlorophos]